VTRNAARDPRIGDEVIRRRSAPDPPMPVTSPLWRPQDARSDRTGPRPARRKAASPTVGMAAAASDGAALDGDPVPCKRPPSAQGAVMIRNSIFISLDSLTVSLGGTGGTGGTPQELARTGGTDRWDQCAQGCPRGSAIFHGGPTGPTVRYHQKFENWLQYHRYPGPTRYHGCPVLGCKSVFRKSSSFGAAAPQYF